MIRLLKNTFLVLLFTFSVNFSLDAQTKTTKDSTEIKKDTLNLRYNFKNTQKGGLFLDDLAQKEVIFDKALNQYIILEKIGDYQIKTPIYLTQKEYQQYRLKRDMLQYFKDKVSATNSKKKGSAAAQKDLLPTYYVNNKFFESIFGGNTVKVTPTGNLNLKLGFIYQNTENPQISEENRSSLVFDFDQQINASIRAKIGERLEFTANYDTQASFDFQNLVKIDYTPTEDDILQGIEAGNVAMPIKNSLINGAQSLFGVKTELQFGNTNVTAVFSQQNSESKTVVSEAGASIQEFELRTTDYDNDRHFFLSQFFIDNYANSLKQYPLISSQVSITRIEVWITNRNAATEDFRSIVALADLGESNNANANNSYKNLVDDNGAVLPVNPISINTNGQQLNLPQNNANNIYDPTVLNGIRDISTVDNTLQNRFQMQQGTDYSILENARKLDVNEYKLNSQLGYISLNRRLNDGEVLAVAYEYTVAGTINGGGTQKSFKVGEFSNDGVQAPQNLAVKLLRSEILQTKRTNAITGNDESFPTWRLMMKNIYALGAYPLTQDGFRFEILYRDDNTGIASNVLQNSNTENIPNVPLIQVFKLDQLDQSQFRTADGFFDYVEGITVNSQNGYVIFPEPEPFGNDLVLNQNDPTDIGLNETLDEQFLFKELYLNTKINIKNNFQNKDKYFLKGYFRSESASGIPIGAFNVPRGSVRVSAGGRQLAEGVDYVVDYMAGRVQIIDPGLQASGTPISVSTENNAVFNQQRKTFMGVDVEHTFSEDFVVGATILNIMERPLTPKVNFGADPINNTMFGLNVDYATEVPYFTKLANKLPFVDTDVPSNLSLRADMAYLLPGTPSGIDVAGAATSYIDDFEASQIPISLLSALDWYEASTPKYYPGFFGDQNDLSYNYKRGKLAWYSIDQVFYGIGQTPASINADELSRAETRQINFNEIFPNQQFDVTQNRQARTLDLAYFPEERGSYNFNTTNVDVNDDGTFRNPQENWGGIMRALNTNNFDQANVEFIQFWVMDPYENYSITNEEGLPQGINPNDVSNQVGDLYINLGNISEDIVKDNRKMFENGLPEDGLKLNGSNVNTTIWGDVPRNPSIIYAFSEEDAARTNQDLGFDGLNDLEEQQNLQKLSDSLNLNINFSRLNADDIASDNFQFFRGGSLDAMNASIIKRYKDFNNTQGNSPTLNQSTETFPTSSTTYPDVEDINRDQTMNTVESYYEYRISMNKNDLQKGRNFIVDEKTTSVTLENGNTQQTKWYQFRVPIRNGTPINGISDFNSIRFVRMFLTNFKMPVVLRFGELDLVRGDWRRYIRTIDPAINPDRELNQAELESFEVGVVSIEQNNGSYIQPPGIERERLQGTTSVQLQNEQAVTLKVNNLEPNEARAIYKNISIDLRRFKTLKMFMHLQPTGDAPVSDNDFSAIIRLGTDLNDNFYQIEVPLKVSTSGATALDIWPEENNLDALLETFGRLKVERDAIANVLPNEIYPAVVPGEVPEFKIRVKGNPTLAQLRTVTLGLKNNAPLNKSAEVWFNELRSAGFDNEGGWAAVMNADANFADVANVSLSGSMQTIGFGNVEDRVNQRSLDETKQYDIATSVNLGKVLTPQEWGIQLPMSYSVGEKFIDPKFDPQYQDVTLQDALEQNPNSEFSRDYTKRTSISFINVKKNRSPNTTKKPKFYDVENLAVSYSHNKEFHRDYNIEKYINENVMASAAYNFSFDSKSIELFKNSERFKSKYWKFIKDLNFNPVPSTLAINSRINRNYNEQQSRNLIEGLLNQPELKQRRFLFDWDYTVGFSLTKSLELNFNATNNYIYDAFGNGEELQIFDNFFNTGRPNQYHQKLNTTYAIPLSKFPFLSFIQADYAYTADFDWQVSSQDETIAEKIGNVIQNANTHNLNTTFSFDKIYKKIGFEKLLLTKSQRKNAKGKNVSRIQLKKNLPVGKKILKGAWEVLTAVKQGKISYTENNGQYLQGYDEGIGFLGGSPTAFAFGSQVDIRNKALTNGWLVNPRALIDNPNTPDDESAFYNKTYSRTHYNKLDYTFTLKPFNDLNIDVRGNKIKTSDLSQQLDIIEDGSENGAIDFGIDAFETGNFSSSHSMFSTAFTDGDALFQKMKDYRSIISNRFASENPSVDPAGFGANSQQVLLPAFMAAYSGKNPNKVNTSLFRNIPIPNWTLRYNGFMKMKWFKKNFSSFVVSHGYRSSYTISSFTNNLAFQEGENIINANSGSFEPQRLVASATLVDEFSPLIKVDMKMKNSFSLRGEVKRDRTLTMNFNNSTLTDIAGTEYIFGLGYVFKDVKMNTRFTGKKTTLRGDVNLRADISLRDNLTQIRYVEEDNNQISGGQRLFSIKFVADYRLSGNLTASFYYNHQTSKYAISTTFPRQAINGGINIVYNLGGN
ncbi:cell surface protein SprA [Polaribacter litorisediminis]|uniref:T9SS outer membrane translocon Sov/SprA n=1 Tax=Polaribacter litorisediminis TaxID=1908341 RepID=UPI001CBB056F|nr:cell surface protein SprA [Polaribacter litorisediminis]UAM96981.1 cell surface protein SprA [Polaribacter litorisediminis]